MFGQGNRDLLKPVIDTNLVNNSREGFLMRSAGYHTDKTITLSANNTTAQENIYQIIGSVEIIALQGTISDTTTFTNCTAAYLDLYDGTNSPDITLASGVALSGMAVGTFLIKNGDATVALGVADNSQCRVTEPSSDKTAYQEFIVTQKSGTNTYIRFIYTTTDAPINAQIDWHCIWRPVNGGTLIAVA